MIVIISPAKRLDFKTDVHHGAFSQPDFLDDAEALVQDARKLAVHEWQGVMKLSDDLAGLTHQRFQDFAPPFDLSNAKQAVFAFKGDAYQGLDAESLSEDELAYAQDHLRILSGFYGLLRPLDLIQAYRLEMGAKLRNARGANLYDFWGTSLTDGLNEALAGSGDAEPVLVKLASNEYFGAVQPGDIRGRIITPQFKEIKDGEPRVMSMYAKRARGLMSRFIIRNRISEPEGLKGFNLEGYAFNRLLSEGDTFVFTRDYPPKK